MEIAPTVPIMNKKCFGEKSNDYQHINHVWGEMEQTNEDENYQFDHIGKDGGEK